MDENLVLCCHSPALSYLLHEGLCSKSDQVGLLLGSIKSHVTSSITDDPDVLIETKTIVYIEHSVTVLTEDIGPFGQISEDFVSKWIEPYKKNLIGWFSGRRQYKSPKASIRDMLFHRRLLQIIDPELLETFVFGLLSTITPYPKSTHSFHYAFHRFNYNAQCFVEFPVKICNLSDRTTDAKGCLESRLYPEAENFRKPNLNLSASASGHISDPLQTYMGDCNEILDNLCKRLYECEWERKKLESELKEYRGYVFPDRPVPIVLKKPSLLRPVQTLGAQMLKYDSEQVYGDDKANQINLTGEDSDDDVEIMDNEDAESINTGTDCPPKIEHNVAGDNNFVTVTETVTEIDLNPNDGQERQNQMKIDNAGDGGKPVEQMDLQFNQNRVSPNNVSPGGEIREVRCGSLTNISVNERSQTQPTSSNSFDNFSK